MNGATIARLAATAATGDSVKSVELFVVKGNVHVYNVRTNSGRKFTISVNIYNGEGKVFKEGSFASMNFSTGIHFD